MLLDIHLHPYLHFLQLFSSIIIIRFSNLCVVSSCGRGPPDARTRRACVPATIERFRPLRRLLRSCLRGPYLPFAYDTVLLPFLPLSAGLSMLGRTSCGGAAVPVSICPAPARSAATENEKDILPFRRARFLILAAHHCVRAYVCSSTIPAKLSCQLYFFLEKNSVASSSVVDTCKLLVA